MVGYEVGKGKVGDDEEVRCYIDFTRSFDITGSNSTVWFYAYNATLYPSQLLLCYYFFVR